MRLLLFFSLICSGLSLNAFQNGINTFVYHRFGDDRFPSTNIRLNEFEAHLKHLKSEGYQLVSASQAAEMLQSEITGKVAAITIDDGYKSFFENGLPLLEQYGFVATLYINTKTVGSSDYMSWEEIKAAEAAGIEIGNHSHSHDYFLNSSNPAKTFQEDLSTSESLFEEHFGKVPKTFAYPFGEWNNVFLETLKDSGYKLSFAQNSGVASSNANILALPRFPMNEHYGDLKDFKSKLAMEPLFTKNIETNGNSSAPEVSFEIAGNSIQINQLQCFIQGNECELEKDGNSITAKGKTELSARRTLFTFTAPDNKGGWHWFSYLWVLPEVR